MLFTSRTGLATTTASLPRKEASRPENLQKIPMRALTGACLVIVLNVTNIRAGAPLDSNPPAPQTTSEQFSTDPLRSGWEQTGKTNLFQWDPAAQNLQVTWDSREPNSYLRLPFPAGITSEDDFSFALDFLLHDLGPARAEYPGSFQIAFGFQNRADADQPGFIRGTGTNSPNVVEFNYFWDSGFGATVWPTMAPANGVVNYSGAGDFGIFSLPLDLTMRLSMAYTASNHTVTLTITTNGVVVGEVVDAPLVDVERGFRLDAFAISSYSDAGQDPGFPGSVLAHGTIDNIEIVTPPRPIGSITGQFIAGEWTQQFETLPGWKYQLEGSDDLAAWVEVGPEVQGDGKIATVRVPDQQVLAHRFFRVKALR